MHGAQEELPRQSGDTFVGLARALCRGAIGGIIVYEVSKVVHLSSMVDLLDDDIFALWEELRDCVPDGQALLAHLRDWCGTDQELQIPFLYRACTRVAVSIVLLNWQICHAVAFGARL